LKGFWFDERMGAGSGVPVGDYRRFELNHVGAFVGLLSGEIWLAFAFAMLLVGTCGRRSSRTWAKVLLTIGWLLWGITVWFSPARVFGYFETLLPLLVIAGAIFIIPPAIDAAYRICRSSKQAFGRLMMYASAGLIAFLLPYVLWAVNSLPSYTYAILSGLTLGAILLFLAYRSTVKSIGDHGAAKTETG